MYGWDSAFIVMGLLRDGQLPLARDIVDDFLYEVRQYAGVLNANRTYYLTRSQPPLLSGMVLAVFRASGDRAWLAEAREAVAATHAHWVAPPHLLPSIGLSRYFDHGEGPAPEVVASERDLHGQTHDDRVRASFRAAKDPAFDRYYDRAHDALTPLFYAGDRAMRESGFDSHRTVRAVRRRDHPSGARLPQHPALSYRARPRRDRRHPRPAARRCRLE